jgi:peptidoglycan/LPS O-acetylase OafA/YrhL
MIELELPEPIPAVKPKPVKVASSAPAHLGFLDGLRGGAALWVLLSHCMLWGAWERIRLPDAKIAVDVFMVLSGFLMVRLSLERDEREPIGTTSTAMRFWIRRFFRIAPLYYLVVAFAFIFGQSFKAGVARLIAANPDHFIHLQSAHLPQYTHYTLSNLLMHLSFLFGFVPAFASSTLLPDWSIGLEMQFYLAFPLMMFLYRRLPAISATLLIFAIGAFLKRLTLHALGQDAFPEASFLPLKINVFMAGMLLAFANRPLGQPRVVVSRGAVRRLLGLELHRRIGGFDFLNDRPNSKQ